MALQRPVGKALACHGCQQWVLRSFIAAAGGTPASRHPKTEWQPRRPFSIAHRRRNEFQQNQNETQHPLNEINDSFAEQAPPTQPTPPREAPPTPKPQNDLPWYLQHAPPIPRQNNPLQSRQQLPPLPSHPPPLLQPLLSHLSMDLGLDDLNLLDLRSLDPPPALGANLLMIVGTARSEKHLHVTADRLCRWLRSEHGLRPHADGLLGRNELKLKLKRRAKRSTLLSAVGAKATAQTEIDDGIRTGWVCVNVGRVEGGELPGQKGEERKVVGFGPAEGGCSVVVQLMTEEKRGEVELEALWEENLGRARRKRDRESKVEDEDEGEGEGAEKSTEPAMAAEQSPTQAGSGYYPFSAVSNQSVGQAVRAYHTATRRLQASPAVEVRYAQDFPLPPSTQPGEQQADTTSSTGNLETMLLSLKTKRRNEILETLGPNILAASSQLSLDTSTQPVATDTEATPFLREFYATMPAYPGPEHWHQHIAILSLARRAGHPEAHSPVLLAQLRNMQIAGLIPLERTFQLVIESVLAPLGPWDKRRYMSTPSTSASTSVNANAKASRPSDAKLAGILGVLEDMEACGYDAVQPAILSPLYRACVGTTAEGAEVEPKMSSSEGFKAVVRRFQLARLEGLARKREWEEFWRVWRSYPARFLPRTGEVYTVLFSAIGKGFLTNGEGENQQRGCDLRETIEVLRSTLEEMENEQPSVRVEDSEGLARAVMSALEFVEPELKGARAEARGKGREWFGWYERCLSVTGGRAVE